MANRPPLADMRAALAAFAAAGDWKPSKPIGDYQPDQVARKYASFTKQLAAGERPSNQAARGHAQTEHGRPSGYAKEQARAPQRPPPEPLPRMGAGLAQHGPGVGRLPNGDMVVSGHSKATARFGTRFAEDLGEHKRIKVFAKDTQGRVHQFGSKGGIDPAWLRERLAGGGSMSAILSAIAAEIYGEDDAAEVEYTGEYDLLIV